MASTYMSELRGDGVRRADRSVPLAEGDPLPPDDRVALASGPDADTLYRAHQPSLIRFLRQSVGSAHAGDLVQHVFLRFCGLVSHVFSASSESDLR